MCGVHQLFEGGSSDKGLMDDPESENCAEHRGHLWAVGVWRCVGVVYGAVGFDVAWAG